MHKRISILICRSPPWPSPRGQRGHRPNRHCRRLQHHDLHRDRHRRYSRTGWNIHRWGILFDLNTLSSLGSGTYTLSPGGPISLTATPNGSSYTYTVAPGATLGFTYTLNSDTISGTITLTQFSTNNTPGSTQANFSGSFTPTSQRPIRCLGGRRHCHHGQSQPDHNLWWKSILVRQHCRYRGGHHLRHADQRPGECHCQQQPAVVGSRAGQHRHDWLRTGRPGGLHEETLQQAISEMEFALRFSFRCGIAPQRFFFCAHFR